mgnify:CR=1 FL=1
MLGASRGYSIEKRRVISPSLGFLESKATRDKLRPPELDKRRVPTAEQPVPSLYRKINVLFEKNDPPEASVKHSPILFEKNTRRRPLRHLVPLFLKSLTHRRPP